MRHTPAIAALVAIFIIPSVVYAQSGANGAKSNHSTAPSTASLSKPIDGGHADVRVFTDSEVLSFWLATSWIPGEKHQGMMRYKLNVYVADARLSDGSSVPLTEGRENVVRRASRCSFYLELFDKDGFVLRRHLVPFSIAVDEKTGHIWGLLANDSFQMDAQEYRQWTNDSSWKMGWTCPQEPAAQ
jgi:hypothetical protein